MLIKLLGSNTRYIQKYIYIHQSKEMIKSIDFISHDAYYVKYKLLIQQRRGVNKNNSFSGNSSSRKNLEGRNATYFQKTSSPE